MYFNEFYINYCNELINVYESLSGYWAYGRMNKYTWANYCVTFNFGSTSMRLQCRGVEFPGFDVSPEVATKTRSCTNEKSNLFRLFLFKVF